MAHKLERYDIYPLVFPADSDAEIHVKPLFKHANFDNCSKLRIDYSPMLFPSKNYQASSWGAGQDIPFELTENGIIIHKFLTGEQEHGFAIYETNENGEEKVLLRFNIYSLGRDLFSLRPFKGDFHMHSMESDGKESPEYVIASCRKVGFDFAVLTDHGNYEASLKAKKFAESVPTALKVFPGEEVHLPDNPVHIVNFGSSFSVNKLATDNEEQYRKTVNQMASKLPKEVPKFIRFQLAASEWAYDKIRQGGGLAMFCHPYWRPNNRQNYIWEECVKWMFKRSKFDILELLGGFYRDQVFSNNESVARYNQEMIKSGGKVNWAVAGVSDAHGCDRDLFGWYYTVLLAENSNFESLKSAFKAKRSVAVKAITNECPEIYGDLRYVRYIGFLMKYFYPIHDKLSQLEGRLMLRHLAGEEGICDILSTFPDRNANLFDKYWSTT